MSEASTYPVTHINESSVRLSVYAHVYPVEGVHPPHIQLSYMVSQALKANKFCWEWAMLMAMLFMSNVSHLACLFKKGKKHLAD